jgi:hypothetical protein
MRTSGTGGRDIFMLSVPVSVLVFFVIASFGGVTPFLRSTEHMLTSIAEWVMALFV